MTSRQRFRGAEIEERFWAKVDWDIREPERCWEWISPNVDKNGYGKFKLGTGLGNARSHRVAYELEIGSPPEGLVLDHYKCDNPKCCNPWHLKPVTNVENVLRGNSPAAKAARLLACERCGSEFTVVGENSSGSPRRGCIPCRKKRQRDYYLENRDKILSRNRQRYREQKGQR